jgi:precorrin-3B synthase
MIETLRKGWCPGALAPMLSGDGYIFRLRLTNGVLSFERAKIFADLARRYGNGAFDLSARANLQMRGVGADNISALQAELAALGLLDADPRAEAVRNIVASPLAGFDNTALIDARPLVEALNALLIREKALHDLPPKFGFSVDGRGVLPLRGVETDIGFSAFTDDESLRLRVSLGGIVVGSVTLDHFLPAAENLARNFLRLRDGERRMAALVARLDATVGVAGLFDHAPVDIEAPQKVRAPLGPEKFLGAHYCGEGAFFAGAGLLFGRVDADSLAALAHEAQACGAAELRLTPWRTLLAVGLNAPDASALAARCADLGFLVDASDPRLAFTACPGAPACASALDDVRAVALALAPHWRADAGRVHVSGCVKGCAMNARALTFVAGRGGYALVENGFARDEPVATRLGLAAMQQTLKKKISEKTLQKTSWGTPV